MATVSKQWGYSVPLEGSNGNTNASSSRVNLNDARSLSRQNSAWDLQSDSEATRTRKITNRAANAGASRKRSRNALRDVKRDRSEKREEHVDDSAWIHRDKLAQIEIREMEEAGFPIRHSQRSMSAGPGSEYDPRMRSASRSEARPPTAQDRPYDEIYDDEPATGYGEMERKRVSTIPAADDEEEEEEAHVNGYTSDFRVLNDATERPPSNGRSHHVRPSTSRIPISAKSPVPVSPELVSRDTPLPRSRAGSSVQTNNWDELNRRARNGSISSQVQMNGAEFDGTKTPTGSLKQNSAAEEPSPPKARTPQKAAAGTRKAAGPATRPGSSQGNRGRRPSGSASASTAATKRSESSQGHKAQTSVGYTWDPAEADAPWVTNLYKPDPRLPPDQQILPTHMKRMMQEQWEKEGKTGTAYDRQFGLLNDDEFPQPKSPEKSPVRAPIDQDLQIFPRQSEAIETKSPSSPVARLGSPASPTDVKNDANSIRAGAGSGGYRITPSITQTPNMYRSPLASPQLAPPNALSNNNPIPRIPAMDEKEEAEPKKGCCCIIM